MTIRVLITGATGFLGGGLAKVLHARPEFYLTAAVRRSAEVSAAQVVEVPGLDANTDWAACLARQHVVIHAAARAHILKDKVVDQAAEYRRVNVEGTLNLARQAAQAGVRRFIFISSIGVNGAGNQVPFMPVDKPAPAEPYAQSKWEAEQGLMQLAEQSDMEIVIIRPPLVYGPGAPGNFGRMVHWVEKGIPLPLGAVHNRRTLVGLDNLVDLIRVCIEHPAAANRVILAGDDEDVSTTRILQAIAEGMGKPSRLIPVPESLLRAGACLLGKRAMAEKVLGSLQVDISETKRLLGWQPPYSFAEGIKRCFE